MFLTGFGFFILDPARLDCRAWSYPLQMFPIAMFSYSQIKCLFDKNKIYSSHCVRDSNSRISSVASIFYEITK